MNLYEPHQYLSFQKIVPPQLDNSEPITPVEPQEETYLKSTTSILVEKNETVSKFYDKNNPFLIKFQIVKCEVNKERHVERNVVYIQQKSWDPKIKYDVEVKVYNTKGVTIDKTTSTISGDADIRE